jgi:hypothetical protein
MSGGIVLEAGFRIRIHLIRIRNQHFRLNTDPDPDPIQIKGSHDQKLKKKKKIFGIKNFKLAILGLHKKRPSYKRSLQLSKENIQPFKT